MELSEVLRTRRMTRSYDSHRPVPATVVKMLLNRAIRAPSAGHTQGRRFLVLDDITSRARFWSATSSGVADSWRRRIEQAPVLVVCFCDQQAYLDRYAAKDKVASSLATRPGNDWAVPYWHVDTGMAAMILLLAAHDAGLGACFFGVPSERWPALFDAFDVPVGLVPVGVISLGYPTADRPDPALNRPRQPYDEQVRYRSFGSSAAR
ncbi:MAG: nitroreductase family protein [Actinomycetota bacterium]|nr:nitroreductase family protein [Actinomycetota bacterium]